jgi:hypothetical protein
MGLPLPKIERPTWLVTDEQLAETDRLDEAVREPLRRRAVSLLGGGTEEHGQSFGGALIAFLVGFFPAAALLWRR